MTNTYPQWQVVYPDGAADEEPQPTLGEAVDTAVSAAKIFAGIAEQYDETVLAEPIAVHRLDGPGDSTAVAYGSADQWLDAPNGEPPQKFPYRKTMRGG